MIFKLTAKDSDYPAILKEIPDPPEILYAIGQRKFLTDSAPVLAVVGTRKMTVYGKTAASNIVFALARLGVIIVSGLATGIDTVAHQAALAANGKTIAVLASGVDVVYPPENSGLYRQISEKGLLLSEFPPGTLPKPRYFPQRNRIVSGLSLGVLVVEGPLKSGSLITAKLALDQGREVFAVPGPITSPNSRGTSYLIKNGAMVVESAEDIMDCLTLR